MPSVSLKDCFSVRPCDPTWIGVTTLTEFDQIGGCLIHEPLIYFYPPSLHATAISISHTLRHSLSRALVSFYPLAGRLQWIDDNGHLELHCNAMGAQFIEAECESSLDDVIGGGGDDVVLYSSPEYPKLFPNVDYTIPLHQLPLFLVQLTVFKCGGFSIGVAISHALVDGPATFYFISEWAKVARGEPIQRMPFHDRSVLQAREPPVEILMSCFDHFGNKPLPLILGQSNAKEEREKKTTMTTLKITKVQVEKLRKMANESWAWEKPMGHGYTRYESITSHIWRSTCKARKHKNEQVTELIISVDSRSRLKPPLSKEYFGNANFNVNASSIARDLVLKPLGFAASKIRHVMEMVCDEYVRSRIGFLKNQQDLTRFQNIHPLSSDQKELCFYGNPNLEVVSWLNLSLYGFDFGFGKEMYMGGGPSRFDGECVIFDSHDGDGSILVCMCLQAIHMDAFKKHFYEDMNCDDQDKIEKKDIKTNFSRL